MQVRGGITLIVLLVAAALALPGGADSAFPGIPLGEAGTMAMAAAVVAAVLFRRVSLSRRAVAVLVVAAAALLVGRVAVGRAAGRTGWSARYYANTSWAGTPEWSSDFRSLGATRIDARIAFHDDTFPAHYLNGPAFDRGIRREVSEPMSVEWRGTTTCGAPRMVRVALTARGRASLAIDDRPVLDTLGADASRVVETNVSLAAGVHTLTVRYVKAADTDGLIAFAAEAGGVPIGIHPPGAGRPARPGLLQAARAIDAGLLLLLGVAVLAGARRLWASAADRAAVAVPAALWVLFGAQGWWQARRFTDRFYTLTAGDDWWGFESCARDILQHGPLMTLGKPLGAGAAYFYHPLYCYFLAAVHAIAGETLFGPIFVQFLVLAAVAVLMWLAAGELFGGSAALAGVLALVIVLELDFTRYYTVTLLSENLYVLTVTLTVLPFMRWVRDGRRADLLRTALWGGISSITRPPMMVYFVPALLLAAVVAAVRHRRVVAALTAPALTAAVWLAAIAPVTLRNWVVAHRFVLISDNLGSTFIKYNVPASVDAGAYAARYTGSVPSGLVVLARIALDHPIAFVLDQGRKLGFSLGMVQWYGGYRPHPELVAVTLLYLVVFLRSARMRALDMWPVHLFVLAHLLSMGLTMPWNYGYRLIIPPFIYTSTVSAAAAWALWASPRGGVAPGTGQPA